MKGIFFAGNKHVAIKVVASYSEDQLITSDPRQLLEIEEAKKEFEVQDSELSYKIKEEGTKGFIFGIGSKPYILEIYINENFLINKIREFLDEILTYFDEEIDANIKAFGKTIVIYLDGEGLGKLIGKHGRTLGALQHLIMIYVNRMTDTK